MHSGCDGLATGLCPQLSNASKPQVPPLRRPKKAASGRDDNSLKVYGLREKRRAKNHRSAALLARVEGRYSFAFLRRSAFVITDTELKLIAAAAMMGLSRMPNLGYSTPAAIGTPTEL